jgi:lysophospholipid acyltransferase (LPLAT)-like uncharacterized protein
MSSKEFRIFNISWFDVKTKFKSSLRSFVYWRPVQEIIASLVVFYMKFVYFSCKKTLIGQKEFEQEALKQKPIIVCFWHNRLMMVPIFASLACKNVQKIYPQFCLMTLASKHGDGRIVGRVMEKFNFKSVLGSTQNKRNRARGIDIKTMREIFTELKKGNALGITPDGPRGPNQKINSQILEMAKISNATLFAISYSTSNFIELNSWDKFKFALPFGKISFYCQKVEVATNEELEEKLNFVQEKTLENLCKN